VVPRVAPRREQLIRAQRMNDLGLIDILHPDQLSPSAVAHWLAREPAAIPSARKRIDLNGTMKLPGLLQSLLAEPARARPSTRATPFSEVGHVAS